MASKHKLQRSLVSALIAMSVVVASSACGASTQQSGGTSQPAPWSPPPPPGDVDAMPAPAPTLSPQDLDPSTYESLSPRDFALIVKDPDANRGRKIVVYGVVIQFDAATGQSLFRATTGAEPGDYGQNTLIEAHDPTILAKVVQWDTVTMWCQVKGSVTYETQTGGEDTVPKFWVNIIKDTGSVNPDEDTPTDTPMP